MRHLQGLVLYFRLTEARQDAWTERSVGVVVLCGVVLVLGLLLWVLFFWVFGCIGWVGGAGQKPPYVGILNCLPGESSV